MTINLTIATVLPIGYAIVILWRASMNIREQRTILPFMPFFLWAISINVLGAYVFYEMYFTFWWFLLDLAFFFYYVWLLLYLVRLIKNQS